MQQRVYVGSNCLISLAIKLDGPLLRVLEKLAVLSATSNVAYDRLLKHLKKEVAPVINDRVLIILYRVNVFVESCFKQCFCLSFFNRFFNLKFLFILLTCIDTLSR